jgi:FkbM family methyltransferase
MKLYNKNKIKNFIRRSSLFIKVHIVKDKRSKEFKRWFDDDGDKTLRFNYSLNQNSVVFDLGGYVGDFAAEIHNQYKCKIYLFEPVPDFFTACQKRFQDNKEILIYPFGLASENGTFPISFDANASSITVANEKSSTINVQVQSIADFISSNKITSIDLMKINIEGGEFDILPSLISTGLINIINEFQIQFHDFIPDAEFKRNEIRKALSLTHQETWCYTFVWENWKKKI